MHHEAPEEIHPFENRYSNEDLARLSLAVALSATYDPLEPQTIEHQSDGYFGPNRVVSVLFQVGDDDGKSRAVVELAQYINLGVN